MIGRKHRLDIIRSFTLSSIYTLMVNTVTHTSFEEFRNCMNKKKQRITNHSTNLPTNEDVEKCKLCKTILREITFSNILVSSFASTFCHISCEPFYSGNYTRGVTDFLCGMTLLCLMGKPYVLSCDSFVLYIH